MFRGLRGGGLGCSNLCSNGMVWAFCGGLDCDLWRVAATEGLNESGARGRGLSPGSGVPRGDAHAESGGLASRGLELCLDKVLGVDLEVDREPGLESVSGVRCAIILLLLATPALFVISLRMLPSCTSATPNSLPFA